MATVRVLEPGDEEVLERFLASRPDTTVFLRSNWRRGGLAYRGESYQGTYAAAFEDGEIVAVASHVWLGTVITEAPRHLEEVVTAALRASARPLKGFIGVEAEARAARTLLGLDDVSAELDSGEDLFSLELEQLRVPEILSGGVVRCRPMHADDLPLCVEWRIAYCVETMGATDGPELRERCEEMSQRWLADGPPYLLEKDGERVSLTGFNARVPDCVQVGGVWTPPELRSKGYARAAVAGSLLDVRAHGVTRSILFTQKTNHAAKACYLGLGYEIVGDYALILFADEHTVSV